MPNQEQPREATGRTEWVTTSQAAALISCTARTVQKYARQGRFPGASMPLGRTGGWRIPVAAIHNYLREASK